MSARRLRRVCAGGLRLCPARRRLSMPAPQAPRALRSNWRRGGSGPGGIPGSGWWTGRKMASQWLRQEEVSEPGLLPEPDRHYLALTLPRWATDCLKRADPSLASLTRPLVLWEKQKGAMRVVALDLAASAAGLFIGQSLSDARAICPILEAREIDQQAVTQLFADFADWHSNASPLVGLMTDRHPYGDLVLDITGVSHLFGGETAMLERLTGR